MNNGRWQQVEEIFNEAVPLEGSERDSYLTAACSADPALREEIESLISSLEGDKNFLQQPILLKGLKILAADRISLSAGDSIGTYKILSALGIGGMGSVYLAHDPRLGRNVALKLLPPAPTKDPEHVKRFRQEARAASKISHPNVASIYEVGEVKQQHFIAMEFVDGVTLRERLSPGPLSVNEAIEIAVQAGRAVEAAHATGIVHRDIKPENIMIRPDGYVKVLDFGLAKLTESPVSLNGQSAIADDSKTTRESLTQPGVLLGTVTYMSPEQARGQEVDGRTDIWSWGVVFYEMLTGEPPFQAATSTDLLADILRVEPALLSPDSPTLPASLKEILRRSLAKEREHRYETLSDVCNELQRLQKKLEAELDGSLSHDPGLTGSQRSDLSTAATEHVKSAPIHIPPITDSHVIGNQLPTNGAWRRTFSSMSGNVSSVLSPGNSRTTIAMVLGVAILVIAVFMVQRLRTRNFPVSQLQFTRLSLGGNIREAAISPDGRYIASIVDEAGSVSLWLRQTKTSIDLRLIGPTHGQFRALSFSPDAEELYYLRAEAANWVLYHVSVLGGAPRKLVENVPTPVTFSPDGRQMAFVRQQPDGASALITANPDGAEEKVIARLQRPQAFLLNFQYSTGPVWSPDGTVIAAPGFIGTDSAQPHVLGVSVSNGAVKAIDAQRWSSVRKLVWLSDGSGLIVNAKDQTASPSQLWLLSYPNGEARKITNDPEDYLDVSGTSDSDTLLATEAHNVSSAWIVAKDSRSQQISSSNHEGRGGITWTYDSRLVYAKAVASNTDLWAMNSDGSARRQLTFDGQRNVEPVVSPDGRDIAFVSYRDNNKPHVWRINSDGTGLQQLTNGNYEDTPRFSADGRWVVYHHLDPEGLSRIPVAGGDAVPISEEGSFPDVSPDGKLIVYLVRSGPPSSAWTAAIIPFEGGPVIKSFTLASGFGLSLPGLRWTPDGLAVTYVLSTNGASNIWSQPLSGDPPRQLTNFAEGQIFYFAWSPDGQLACVRGTSTKDLLLVKNFH